MFAESPISGLTASATSVIPRSLMVATKTSSLVFSSLKAPWRCLAGRRIPSEAWSSKASIVEIPEVVLFIQGWDSSTRWAHYNPGFLILWYHWCLSCCPTSTRILLPSLRNRSYFCRFPFKFHSGQVGRYKQTSVLNKICIFRMQKPVAWLDWL